MHSLTSEENKPRGSKTVVARIAAAMLVLVSSVIFALGFAELALRLMVKRSDTYSMLIPGARVIEPDARYISGVVGPAHYEVNAAGYRGRAFGADESEYRILLVGGSTTECTLLDVAEHWGTIVEKSLQQTRDGRNILVGNVGRSGLTARDHAVTVKYLLRQYPRIDLVVVLVGVNDLTAALRQGNAFKMPLPITDPDADRRQIRNAFSISPLGARSPIVDGAAAQTSWIKETKLYDLARQARRGRQARNVISTLGGSNIGTWRAHRQSASQILDELPSLEAPLTEYRSNLNAIIKAAHDKGADVVFLTQPSLWRPGLTPAEERLLWLGGVGPFQEKPGQPYYSVAALANAMSRYNQATLDACRAQGLNCFDLASAVPADTSMFYDDVHFTEAGSALIGDLVTKHLRQTRPVLFAPAVTVSAGN